MAAMLLRGWMTAEEIQAFGVELEAATPEERGSLVIDLCNSLGEMVEQIEIPKTPTQRRDAEALFSRPCKSLEMQINRRFSQEIHPAKSLRN